MRVPSPLFLSSLLLTVIIVAVKFLLHQFGVEPIALGSLHSSTLSGVIFVIGFLLSATIADYKEAERIPAEAAATIEDMYEDARATHVHYKTFDLEAYRAQLELVATAFASDLRNSKSHQTRMQLRALSALHAAMEQNGIPANYIVKLKQQQAQLTRQLFRVNYIQKIMFIPSATVLAWSIVVLAIGLLLLTEITPFVGGMWLTGALSFILVYVLQLIRVIKIPFHDAGKTRDDVSLFLVDRTIDHLKDSKK